MKWFVKWATLWMCGVAFVTALSVWGQNPVDLALANLPGAVTAATAVASTAYRNLLSLYILRNSDAVQCENSRYSFQVQIAGLQAQVADKAKTIDALTAQVADLKLKLAGCGVTVPGATPEQIQVFSVVVAEAARLNSDVASCALLDRAVIVGFAPDGYQMDARGAWTPAPFH